MIFKCSKLFYQFSTKGPKFGVNTVKGNIKQKMTPPPPPKIQKIPNKTQIPLQTNTKKELFAQKKESKEIKVEEMLKKKIPVITVMGHVDHGKTTLIDFLRKSNIAQKQDGGITQRIGAFNINYKENKLTFIDTPGHEAFTNMRKRGASLTDLIILVVSATEGVKQQTKEVIKILQQDNIPVVIAINKVDLPEANPEQVQEELEKAGLNLEVNGGSIPVVHISARSGMNIDLLCQLVIEETNSLQAVSQCLGEASVLEAYQTKEGLNSMTIIMEKGTLKIGNLVVIGDVLYKIKSMQNDKGENVESIYPGDAVQIRGIPKIPNPGDELLGVQNEKKGNFLIQKKREENIESLKEIDKNRERLSPVKIKIRSRRQRKAFCRGVKELWMIKFEKEEQKIKDKIQELMQMQESQEVTKLIQIENKKLKDHHQYVFEYIKNTGQVSNVLNFIMKFGEKGMEETTMMQLQKLKPVLQKQTGIKLNLLKSDIGQVTANDVEQAKVWNAKIFTFGTEVSQEAMLVLDDSVPKVHKLIHSLLKDIKDHCFSKKIESIKGVQKGRSTILQIFNIRKNKGKQVFTPGIQVNKGKITKKSKCYIFRKQIPISKPFSISFLKSFKKQVTELKKGEQGTIAFVQQIDLTIQKGDQIVCFEQN